MCWQRVYSRHCKHFNGYRDRCPHIFLPARGGHGLIMSGCRGVAGKPAATSRTRDAKHSSSASQYSYISTAPSPGPSPRDRGVHAPAGVYAATGGWAHRWPSSSSPYPRSGRREEKNATSARQGSWRSGRGRGRRGGGDLGLLASPAIPPPPPGPPGR